MKRDALVEKIVIQLHKKAVELDLESAVYTADPNFSEFKDAGTIDVDGLLSIAERLGMLPPHNSLADAHNTLLLYFHLADKFRKIDAIMKVTGGN